MLQVLAPDLIDHIGQVPADYQHHHREVRPGAPLMLDRAILKWYAVFRAGEGPEDEFDATARGAIRGLVAAGSFPIHHGAGFVIAHHSTANDYLIVCSWYQTQELWHAILVRPADRSTAFRQEWPSKTSGSFCVWEMAPMWHERNAWERYLWSPRDADARNDWLNDILSGTT